MYKDRFKHWGLGKYSKEKEMRAIVRKHGQRTAQHKRSIFQVRGKTMNDKDVLRHFSRKGLSISDVMAQRATSKTPEAVVCFTPLPSPITSPQVLKLPEIVLSTIRDYVDGSFDAGTWIKTEQTKHCYNIKEDRHHPSNTVQCFLNLYREAHELHTMGAFQEAQLVLGSARASIREVLSCEQPDTLFNILRSLFEVYIEVPEPVSRHRDMITASSASMLVEQHPLRRIFEFLFKLDRSDLTEAVHKCFQILSDQFEIHLGAMHIDSVAFRCDSPHTSMDDRQNLLHRCHARLGLYDSRTTRVRISIARKLYKEKNYHLAKQSCYDITHTAHLVQSEYGMSQIQTSTYLRTKALLLLARCQEALSEVGPALRSLREAIDLRISVLGSRHSSVRACIVLLQKWLIASGQEEEAAEVGYWWSVVAHAPAELQY